MGELCRSADMQYITVHVPDEQAIAFADTMCRSDIMQFTDLNENVQIFDRHYQKQIMRLHEAQRALRSITDHFLNWGAVAPEEIEVTEDKLKSTDLDQTKHVEEVSNDITDFYKELGQKVAAYQKLHQQLHSLHNQLEVLQCMDRFMQDAPAQGMRRDSDYMEENTYGVPLKGGNSGDPQRVGFTYLAGVCPVTKIGALRRQIFHITRGNRYFRSETLETENQEGGKKAAFVVFFIGDFVRNMILRFCNYMDVQIFVDSSENDGNQAQKADVEEAIRDQDALRRLTKEDLVKTMENMVGQVTTWNIQLKQEMAIRVLLNKFKHEKEALRAEGWVPSARVEEVKGKLTDSALRMGASDRGFVETGAGKGKKPTYFETNKFTEVFQLLIDTYGVPRNGEFNPTVPSIVTFPFLFAMMYGDMFHGTFLFLAGCYLVWNEDANAKSRNELMVGLHSGRYLIFLMGMFAIYNGLIYNDCTSMSINGFNLQQWETVKPAGYAQPVVNGKATGVYAFGVDPVWAISESQLNYMNSLKMKLSVLVGISQMTYGLFIKLANHIHEGDMLHIFGEFIPQLIFMMTFFNYMQFIIIYKWCQDWTGRETPSLITILVNMILKPGTIDSDTELYDKDLQAMVQVIFVLLMFISVPWMLLVVPLVKRSRINAAANAQHHVNDDEANLVNYVEAQEGHGGHGGHDEDETFGQIMIEQVIHTIEYVLGTVSNTASYLRLWALSLAHAQLAEVFYNKTILEMGMNTGNGAMVFVSCAMFFGMTFAVLMCMDVLECFLHALRLHWVEFQNKFYYADGEAFLPYSYASVADDLE